MEECEGRKREMLTTGEWCNSASNMLDQDEWGLSTRGLRMVVGFWASIPVEVTQETSV